MLLELESKNNAVFGNLRAFSSKESANLLLGIQANNNIIKQNIKLENNRCQFKLSQIELDQEISCVIIDTNNDKFEPILWGSTKQDNNKNNIISYLKNSISKMQSNHKSTVVHSVNNTSTNPTQKEINTLNSTQSSIPDKTSEKTQVNIVEDNISQISIEPENIDNIESEVAIADTNKTQLNLFETDEAELEETINQHINNEHNFYNLIADQLDELFARYPREHNLEQLVENSMWCKIDTEYDNKYYVVGIIKESNDIKYICYGVPGSYNIEPPIEMRNYSQWLPTDPKSPYDNGYWVMYQDSNTGENIYLNT